MKLLAFRIRNFRSIIDTGWHSLSSDDITGLIGQNESGKTSILEALSSFYDGKISEDTLRSDLSMPVVSCLFSVDDDNEITDILKEKLLPAGVIEQIRTDKSVSLEREWNEDLSSRILLGGEKVVALFNKHDEGVIAKNDRIEEAINRILQKKKDVIASFQQAENERLGIETRLNDAKATVNEISRSLKVKGKKDAEEKKKLQNQLAAAKNKVNEIKNLLNEKSQEVQKLNKAVQTVAGEARYAEMSKEAWREFEEIQREQNEVFGRLTNLQRLYDHALSEKERRAIQLEMDGVNDRYMKLLKEYEQTRERAIKRRLLAYKILEGLPPAAAEKETEREKPHINPFYTRLEAGSLIVEHIPEFVMFEDFSSLLPNRIDLDDILNGNAAIEGYKAARNFLEVAGLNEAFFRESNSRILKQKIEKLNRDLTLDFQDFWQQRIGRHNKITINFELEHYDNTHPDKSGFPYLEFWVKDRQERLYPKQRSRGVRWFLSFYLELKAAISRKDFKGKVLLIDEPGLSLHARAQEDVLKVFEHIKDKVQVIYTTHSPHLIDIKKLYRLLAVQRNIHDDENSETVVFDAKSLTSASADTLSPIYTLMGSRLSEQQFIQKKNNIILEDLTNYYYFSAFHALLGYPPEAFFLPATDVSNVQTLVNLLMGWGLDFIVVTDESPEGLKTYQDLKKNVYGNNDNKIREKVILMDGFQGVEDLFSTLDFKKHVLHQRIGIPESNSDFVRDNKLSRTLLASDFLKSIQEMKITDFDEETRENIENVFQAIVERLQA
ncbi:MAG: AAA family ATPase [Bacteroidales bacterium]|nr:AAA family ATPase [Bacteroidales bacterium]